MENRKRVRDGYRGGNGTTTADNARKQTAYHSALLRDVLRPSGGGVLWWIGVPPFGGVRDVAK